MNKPCKPVHVCIPWTAYCATMLVQYESLISLWCNERREALDLNLSYGSVPILYCPLNTHTRLSLTKYSCCCWVKVHTQADPRSPSPPTPPLRMDVQTKKHTCNMDFLKRTEGRQCCFSCQDLQASSGRVVQNVSGCKAGVKRSSHIHHLFLYQWNWPLSCNPEGDQANVMIGWSSQKLG